jgi:hypothetical protein
VGRNFKIKSSHNNYRSSKRRKTTRMATSEEVIEEEIQHVRDKVDKLEKKLKK